MDFQLPSSSGVSIRLQPMAQEHTASEWNEKKEILTQLYIQQHMCLREVQKSMKTVHGFRATGRQYKRRFAQWNLEKNVKDSDMKIILRKQLKRKLEEGKESEFTVNGRQVPAQKIERFVRRKGMKEEDFLRNDIHTPPHIIYATPSGNESIGGGSNFEIGFSKIPNTLEADAQFAMENGVVETDTSLWEKWNDDLELKRARFSQKDDPKSTVSSQTSINLAIDSPFERWSPRYHLSASPSWYYGDITPRNPLSLLSPFHGASVSPRRYHDVYFSTPLIEQTELIAGDTRYSSQQNRINLSRRGWG